MRTVRGFVIASAFLMTACGAGTAASSTTLNTTNTSSVHATNHGPNAAGISDISSKVNLVVVPRIKGNAAVLPKQPGSPTTTRSFGVPPTNDPIVTDRCGASMGRTEKHPLPMCQPA